jgi:hypothetical protein
MIHRGDEAAVPVSRVGPDPQPAERHDQRGPRVHGIQSGGTPGAPATEDGIEIRAPLPPTAARWLQRGVATILSSIVSVTSVSVFRMAVVGFPSV